MSGVAPLSNPTIVRYPHGLLNGLASDQQPSNIQVLSGGGRTAPSPGAASTVPGPITPPTGDLSQLTPQAGVLAGCTQSEVLEQRQLAEQVLAESAAIEEERARLAAAAGAGAGGAAAAADTDDTMAGKGEGHHFRPSLGYPYRTRGRSDGWDSRSRSHASDHAGPDDDDASGYRDEWSRNQARHGAAYPEDWNYDFDGGDGGAGSGAGAGAA